MSARKRFWVALLLVSAMLFSTAPAALGWSNGPNHGAGFGTHDWVMTEARRLAGNPAWLKSSSALAATDDPDMVYRDFYYHVYDVWGSPYGNSPKRVTDIYILAVKAYRARNYAAASRYVGLISHYYSDTCNPLHTDQIAAEDRIHSGYEGKVQTETDSWGENRAWIRYDGYQHVTNVTTKTKYAATFAHRYYSSLVSHYSKYGYDSTSAYITRTTLNRAVNDLADIIRSIPADS